MSTKYGHSYERQAITDYLAKTGAQKDPMTQQPLRLDDLFENFALKHAVAEYRTAVLEARPWWQAEQ